MRHRKVSILKRKKTIVVGWLFALWYVLSIMYNIFNKKALNLAPELAWTAAWVQMTFGLAYVLPLWFSGVRQPPELSPKETVQLVPVAVLHSLVHIGGVVSMGAGAVSFTYIVKASEPAVSAAFSAVFLKSFLPPKVYVTLIPVMAGVALSSVSELTFVWKSFTYAMMSNVASALRGIVGKKTMGQRIGGGSDGKTPLSSANLYAVLTIWSSLLLLPVTLWLEGSLWKSTFMKLKATHQCGAYLCNLGLAALTYYTYNEVSFLCLDQVSPVSHAIGNTLKRVAIIISSMLVFGNKMTSQGIVGSIMAVGGVLLYSLTNANASAKAKAKKTTNTSTSNVETKNA
jgi:solute carrier family 35 protein E1